MSNLDNQNLRPEVFLAPNDYAVERLYPIRNLVFDSEATTINENTNPQEGDTQYRPQARSHPSSGSTGTQDSSESRRVSERFKLHPSKSGAPSVLPGSVTEDEKPTYRRCEDEPIHIPGAVQSYGALVGLKYNTSSQLEVRIASENTRKILGYGPEQLFALESFLDILNPDVQDEIVARITHALKNPDAMKEESRLDVFPMFITFPYEPETRLWCAIHLAPSPQGVVICEFEEYANAFYLKDVGTAQILPVKRVRSTGLDASPEEFEKSTTSASKPLPVIEIARQRRFREFSSLDIFNAMSQAQRQLQSSKSVQEILDVVVGIISELTGFHRVMFYRFDAQKNGCIEAELLNPQASLHYPASDIPKQARDLYKINRIRILHDRDAETARLVARDEKDFEEPLDLTHSYLRAISPVHIKYLTNMGVRSTTSISIVIKDDLWGLIACHGYGDIGIRVGLPIRELCRNIGECAATNIERLLMIQRIEARRPPTVPSPSQHPASFIAASSADLLGVFDADSGLISIQDEARAIGRLDPYREALAILAYLQARRFTSVQSSQNIKADFPDIKYAPGIQTISGLLFLPLSSEGNDFIVFFRKGLIRQVKWAGNPYDRNYKAGSEYLKPRTSFKRWVETISGQSKEWTEDQLESASVLGLLYGRFIEIWRQKESASQNNRMTQLLIRNSSREVRTPLNAIINYLEMALDNEVDDLTCEILERAQRASSSLVYTIDDLLKLTKAEHGPVHVIEDTFNLSETVSEVVTAFREEAIRKGLMLTVTTHEGIPEMVKGDPARLRQTLTNLTRNAFEHSLGTGVKVDISALRQEPDKTVVSISVQDAGRGMSETQLDDLFQSFEQIIDEEPHVLFDNEASSDRPDQSSSIGLGLAVVARYVRNVDGQIRVKSELGKGTIFSIQIPFKHAYLPSPEPAHSMSRSDNSTPRAPTGLSPATRPTPNLPPFMRNIQPNARQILKTVETRTHIENAFSPLTDMQPFGMSPNQMTRLYSPDSEASSQWPEMDAEGQASLVHLRVLVAEDNPISLALLNKRLSRRGHEVELACDGQQCHDYYASNPGQVDVILMDLQMPIVDGALASRMIRYHERDQGRDVPQVAHRTFPRVPIIVISASLYEDSRFEYVQNGFDGWMTKPIDFRRLDFLLQCVKIPELRREVVYTPGNWEKGGWFIP